MEGYVFSHCTITVTAMSGVAAILLMGETTAWSCLYDQKRPIEVKQVEKWEDT